MKKFIVAAGLCVGGVLLASSAWSRPYETPLVVSVSRDDDGCRIVVLGERVTSDRLVEAGRLARKRRAIVIYDKDTPYKCVGNAVSALQHAGLTRIDAVIWDGSGGR